MISPDDSPDLRGQVALVTGAGRGLGRAYARALASAGAAVAALARSADQLEATVALVEAAGGRAVALPADVADGPAVERAVAELERRLGPPDLLVNNAGVGGPIGPAWEVDPEQWWRTMEINLRGNFLCARAVLPGMVARRRGRIINLASNAGAFRWPLVSAYAVSKAALVKFTENLAAETRRHGVAVFAVHPGLVTVGLTEQALSADPAATTDAPMAWIRQEVAAGRAVPPERSGALVLALAGGRADALSGRYLTVDDDLAALVASADAIRRDDLYTLRRRALHDPAGAPRAHPPSD